MNVYGKKIYIMAYSGVNKYRSIGVPSDYSGHLQGYYAWSDNCVCNWERSEQVYTDEADKWTGGIEYVDSGSSTLERLCCHRRIQQSKWGGKNRCLL